jgi:SAM-dependent methyltransferase
MSSAVERLMAGFQELFFSEHFEGKTIIDLGCGFGTWGHTIRSMVIQGGNRAYIVGCDIFRPFLVRNKKYNAYDDLVLCDARYLPFQPKSADIVLSFEMIEHMNKTSGIAFLISLDHLSKDRIVLSTPCGFLEQHDISETLFEEHKSFWSDKDFAENGFQVRKYGLGLNMELAFRSFNVLSLIYKVALLRSRNKWKGVMLMAEKRQRKHSGLLESYEERLKLALNSEI